MDSKFADLTTHRIEGIARMGNKPFDVSLFSQIDGNLWSGGCPVEEAPPHFDYIVSLYPWGRYKVHTHQVYTVATLFDGEEIPNEKKLEVLAAHVNVCRASGPTLVHCQAGLNRSSLVTALALIRGGMTPVAAIALMREKRCDAVLCNEHFERWLMARSTARMEQL